MSETNKKASRERAGEGRGATGRGHRWLLRAGLIAAASLAALAALAVILLSVLFAAGNPALSNRIVAVINRAAGTDSTRFVSGKVRGTVFHGAIVDAPKLLVRTMDGEVTWARARSIRVEYDLFELLLGRTHTLRVAVDAPRIDLVHDRNGDVVVPRFAPHPRGKPSDGETRIELSFREGGLSIDREDIRFGGIGGHATLMAGRGRTALLIHDLGGSSMTPDRPGRLAVSGMVVAEGSDLRADPLEVAVGSSRLTGRVDWDLANGRVREGSLLLHPLHVREFFSVLEAQSADGTLNGEVTFSGTPTAGKARACLEGYYAQEPIDTLVLDARSRPGAIEVFGVRLRIRNAEVTGGGTLFTNGALEAELGFHELNPALLPWWKLPENTPQGSLSGQARIEAHRTKPHPDAMVAVTLTPSRVGQLTITRGFVRIHTNRDGSATLDSGRIDVPGARLLLTGAVAADRSIEANMSGALFDLVQLNQLLGPMAAESGKGRANVLVSGSLDAPVFKGQVDLVQGKFKNGIACDTVTVEIQGRLVPRLELISDIGAHGLRVRGRPLGDITATLTGGDTLRVERYRQALGDTVLTLEGVVTIGKSGVEARVESLGFVAGGHHVTGGGPIHITSHREKLRLSGLVLDLDPGRLEASIDWNPEKDTIDGRGTIDGLDLSRVYEIQRHEIPIVGHARGEFIAAGKIEDPELSLRLDVLGPGVGGIVGDSLTLAVDYAPGILVLDRARWIAGKSRVEVSGSIRPQFTLQEWSRALSRGDHGWASRTALALEASADSFDLALAAGADSSLRSLSGETTLRLRISGTAADPIAELEGFAPRVGYRGVEGAIPAVGISYANRRLRIGRLEVQQGASVSRLLGEFPLDLSVSAEDRVPDDSTIALSVQVPDGDFAVVPILFPGVGSTSGRVSVSAEVSGTPRNPRVTGSLKLAEGKLRLAGRDEILEGIALDASFDQERFTIRRGVAREGRRGKLDVTGWWRWPTSAPPPGEPPAVGPRGEYQFHVNATDFTTTDRETYQFRLTGEIDIVNARNPEGAPVPSIRGQAVATKGELTLDLSKPPGEPGKPLPVLYNISLEIPGNMFYRNLDTVVEVESEGDLIFKNEGRGDLALGMLKVKGGNYYVVTREFRNLSGSINFNSPDRIDPEVSIVGETDLEAPEGKRSVYLSVTDRVSRLKVRVYDEKGTPQNELWKALAFGQFVQSSGIDVTSGGSTGSQESANVAVPISNYLFQNVEHWIGGTGIIDTIDLRGSAGQTSPDGSTTGPISVVGVGKYVTPEFYFKYSRDFSGQAEEQISADYRVTRHLLVKGQQIRRPTSKDQAQQEYIVDLKIRLEY